MAKKSKASKQLRQQQTRKDMTQNIDFWLLTVVVSILAVAPLLVHLAVINHISPLITGTSFDGGKASDFFSYYQFLFTVIGTVIALGLLLYKLFIGKFAIRPSYINIFVAILFIFISLSAVFARYKTFSVFGQYDQHQGTIAYLAYLLLFLITANITYPTSRVKWFVYALYPFILINFILGLLYFYGYNILSSQAILSFIVPSSFGGSLNSGSYISSTVSNPDFISGIGGMFTVLFLSKGILDSHQNQRIASLVLAVMSFCMTLTSQATSGFFTLVVMLPVVIAVILRNERRRQGLLTATVALICFALVFIVLNAHNSNVWNKSLGFFLGSATKVSSNVDVSSNQTSTTGSTGTKLQSPSQDEFNLPPLAWAPGTGRVYIWKKTFELIKQRPLLGYGLDSIMYVFPQDDPGKASGIDDPNTIVDKPHDMYLDVAYGSGLLALLTFIFLIVRHIWAYRRFLKRAPSSERERLKIVVFVAWCAFLVQAVFNDPTTGTSPIFWILFGLGVSLINENAEGEWQV